MDLRILRSIQEPGLQASPASPGERRGARASDERLATKTFQKTFQNKGERRACTEQRAAAGAAGAAATLMFEATCATCCTYFCQISSNNLLVTLVCCIVLLGLLELLMVSLFSSCCTYISRTNFRFLVIILFSKYVF